ncbi:MAG TPA: hypothetical protein PKM73_11810 [Verrucomicrobiota bacterium]|nr:hypothetical protein [Verrucomicrobiota bacterium]
MTEPALTDFERQSLELLLSSPNCADEALRRQMQSVKVRKRDHSGVGLFVEFDVPDEMAAAARDRKVISNLSGQMRGLENGFGGVLYVENGKLKTLEFFTYDEQWPDNPSGYSLRLEKPQT